MSEVSSEQGDLNESQWDQLYRILGGHIYFQTLSAAVALDLFGILKEYGPLTRAEIASRLNVQEKPARILLLGCATLGLVEKNGDQYSNSRLADRTLIRGASGSLVPVIEWQHYINYRPMYLFREAIEANKNVGLELFEGHEETLYGRLVRNPKLERIFQDAMEAISVLANRILADNVDFSQVRRLVDVGGGNGTNIITLARKNPHLTALVFDSPSVCEIARQTIQDAGLSDRLGAEPGNCFDDPFPAGTDCLLFCHFFTIWSEERNRLLLRKSFDALQPGGKVMIFNMMQWDDEKGPLTAAMGSPYFLTLATGEGMLYTWSEYVHWMKDAGFVDVTTQSLPRDHGIIVGTKP
jgi:cyclopropane fatty-acyl-phospholipid synthase-like methyltransferase